ncbi:GNAT family N-acetyltransferase [Chloroflexi bacterium TSY]|nr:GNAT family N-acetyltransferase [Chloroflexi bacterium TSY]
MSIEIRPYQSEDLEKVVDVINDAAQGGSGYRTTADAMKDLFAEPGYSASTDCFVALVADHIVGVRDVYRRMKKKDPLSILESTGAVHSSYQNKGVLEQLIRRVWRRCSEIAQAAGDPGFIFQVRCDDKDMQKLEILKQLGLTVNRRFAIMERPHLDDIDEPILPPGIALLPYRTGVDDRAWHEAYHDAFADHWGQLGMTYEQWLYTVGKSDYHPDLNLVAWDDAQIAGFCYCKISGEMSSIRWLGVRPAWRRRGLGDALTKAGLLALKQAGAKQIKLGVDYESETGPARVYARNGFQVVRWQLICQRNFTLDEARREAT